LEDRGALLRGVGLGVGLMYFLDPTVDNDVEPSSETSLLTPQARRRRRPRDQCRFRDSCYGAIKRPSGRNLST
jgi:hypothetical protein